MIIYKAVNKVNGKVYVGQTVKKLEYRIHQHCFWGQCRAFDNAIRKYGADSFEWSVIDTAETHEELNEKERKWISYFDSISPHGYNLREGGRENYRLSDETRKRISESRIGDKNWSKRPEVREKHRMIATGKENPFYGKRHSPEVIIKMKSRAGANHPSFGKKNPAVSAINKLKTGVNNPMYGRKFTVEERKKFGQPGERNPRYGVKLSDELKQKISEGIKAYHKKRKAALCDPY